MGLNPDYTPLRDTAAAVGEVEAANQRRQERRNGTFRPNRLSVAQRQRREVTYSNDDRLKRHLIASGVVPETDSENDTDDDPEFADVDVARARAEEARRIGVMNGKKPHTYSETFRGAWRPRNFPEPGRPNSNEAESRNSNNAERRTSNNAVRRSSNKANRRGSDEGEIRNSAEPNGPHANEAKRRNRNEVDGEDDIDIRGMLNQNARMRVAAKSKKEEKPTQTQAEEDNTTDAP
jgi:hypothetical protein